VVVALIRFIDGNRLDLDDPQQQEELQAQLVRACPITIIVEQDIPRFNILLELSWAQIDVAVDSCILGDAMSVALFCVSCLKALRANCLNVFFLKCSFGHSWRVLFFSV